MGRRLVSFIAFGLALMLLMCVSVLLVDFGLSYKLFKDFCNETGGYIPLMNKTACFYYGNVNKTECFTWII